MSWRWIDIAHIMVVKVQRSPHLFSSKTLTGIDHIALRFKHKMLQGLSDAVNNLTMCALNTTVASAFLLVLLGLLELESTSGTRYTPGKCQEINYSDCNTYQAKKKNVRSSWFAYFKYTRFHLWTGLRVRLLSIACVATFIAANYFPSGSKIWTNLRETRNICQIRRSIYQNPSSYSSLRWKFRTLDALSIF